MLVMLKGGVKFKQGPSVRTAFPSLNATMPAVTASSGGAHQTKKQKAAAVTELLKQVKDTLKAANEEPNILQHFPAFATYNKNDVSATVSFLHGSQLSQEQKDSIWSLFETNMQGIYSRDDPKWSPKEKRRELFHEDARYFLVTDDKQQLLAFTHFRFEVEENLLAPEEMQLHRLARYDPVLYCYELQLDQAVRRRGVGRRLMQMLELVALKYRMHMVLLTVQRSNDTAIAFYKSMNYKQHPSCPERNAFEDFDGEDPGHRIMFKDLRRS